MHATATPTIPNALNTSTYSIVYSGHYFLLHSNSLSLSIYNVCPTNLYIHGTSTPSSTPRFIR